MNHPDQVEVIQYPYNFDTTNVRGNDKPIHSYSKAVLYARTSPRPQPTEASLAKQIEDCRRKAEEKRYEVIGQFADDRCSGKSLKHRPQLDACLALAEKERAVIVAYDLARVSRKAIDAFRLAERIEEIGSALLTVSGPQVDTTNPHSMLVFRMGAAINEFFREQQGQLTKEALAWRRSQGLVTGPLSYGWEKGSDGKAIANPAKQRLMRWICWRIKNGATYGWIVWELQARGFTRLDSKQITESWVRVIWERWGEKLGTVPIELDWYDCLVNYLLDSDDCWPMTHRKRKPPILLHRSMVPNVKGEWPHERSANDVPAMDCQGRLCLPISEIRELHRAIHRVGQHKPKTKAWYEAMRNVCVPASENDVPQVLRTGFNWTPTRFVPPAPGRG